MVKEKKRSKGEREEISKEGGEDGRKDSRKEDMQNVEMCVASEEGRKR